MEIHINCLAKTVMWISCIAFSTIANGFDSPEHCALSSLAATVAFDYIESTVDHLNQIGKAGPKGSEVLNKLKEAETEWVGSEIDLKLNPKTSASFGCAPSDWSFNVSAIPFSYGKVTALVDYTLDPRTLFSASGNSARIPVSKRQLNSDYFFEVAGEKKNAASAVGDNAGESAWSARRDELSLLLRYWLASHNNPRHFQEAAMDSFYQLHDEAVLAAVDEANPETRLSSAVKTEGSSDWPLFRALAYSALADHFLEDWMAPGHVVTPRNGMFDAIALSWHDAFNDRGRVLAIRNWGQLRPVYQFIEDKIKDPENSYARQFAQIGDMYGSQVDHRIKLSAALEELLWDRSVETRDSKVRCLYERPKNWHQALADMFDSRAKHYASILDLNANLMSKIPGDPRSGGDIEGPADQTDHVKIPTGICAHGDGSLDQHDQRRPGVPSQKAYMVIVEARYILDVLAAYAVAMGVPSAEFSTKEDLNSIREYSHWWCPMIHASPGGEFGTNAETGNCKAILDAASSECEKGTCRDVYMIPTAIMEYGGYLSSPTQSDPLDFGTADFRDFIYGVHANELAANHRITSSLGADVGIGFVLRQPNTPEDVEISNPFPFSIFESAGWEWYLSDTTHRSQAFRQQQMMQLPSIDVQIGLYEKLEDIGNGETRRWRTAYGARIEEGFSLLTLHIALGVEPALQEPVRTVRTFAVETGFSFVVNGRRGASDMGDFGRTLGRWLHLYN